MKVIDPYREQQCSRCKEYRSNTYFYKNRSMSSGLQNECRLCRKIIKKEARDKNTRHAREIKRLENLREHKRKTKDFLEFRKAFKCADCGNNNPVVIQFHHLDPNTKDSTVSSLFRKKDKSKFYAELEKCIPLCCNCHTIRHYSIELEPT